MNKFCFILIGFVWPAALMADPYLLMAEQQGCHWCAKWNETIAPIYHKTAEGGAVPLKRYDIHTDNTEVNFKRRVHFTPSFILVDNGNELGRIEGFISEDFFWGLLAQLLQNANIPLEQTN